MRWRQRLCEHCLRPLPTYVEHMHCACAVCILIEADLGRRILSPHGRAALERLVRMRSRVSVTVGPPC